MKMAKLGSERGRQDTKDTEADPAILNAFLDPNQKVEDPATFNNL